MGFIEVRQFTSAAEMMGFYAERQRTKQREFEAAKPKRPLAEDVPLRPNGNTWITKTPRQRCALIRDKWTPGASMQEVADRITLAIEWRVTKAMVLSHFKNYKDRFLQDIEFNANSGYRGLFGTMSEVEHEGLTSTEYFKALCHSVHVTPDAIRADDRSRDMTQIRQIAVYLLNQHFPELTNYKLGSIVSRDPTTAKASINRVTRFVRARWPDHACISQYAGKDIKT